MPDNERLPRSDPASPYYQRGPRCPVHDELLDDGSPTWSDQRDDECWMCYEERREREAADAAESE